MGEVYLRVKQYKRFWSWALALVICFSAALSSANTAPAGYILDVETEISNDPVELVLFEKPEHLNGPSFNEKVFNHELSQEFIFNYQQVFGRTEQEESYYLVNRQGYFFTGSGVLSSNQVDTARREFAQYMAKRLVEYHGENVMKTEPQFKKIYEIKQAVSNVNLAVNETTRFDMTYSFVGNTANMKMTHAISDAVCVVNMDPGSFAPTAPREITLMQQKSWTTTFRNEFGYTFYSKSFRATFLKQLSPVWSLDFTQTIAMNADVKGIDPGRESLSLAGLKFIF